MSFDIKSSDNVVEEVEVLPIVPNRPKRPRRYLSNIMRHWMTVSFIFGFVIDNLTLNRVDEWFDNFVLASYVVLAFISIVLLYASVAEKLPEKITPLGRKYLPLLVQFSFGGLLSGMLIFYGRSGAWLQSWPFLLIILLAIYGNETIKDRSSRLIYNLAIFFVGLMAYMVLLIPVLTGHMGAWIFIGSGLLALFIMYFCIQFLYRIIPRFMDMQMRAIVLTVGGIYMTFNFLYFTNIIPPIPLSLKELGVYHSVVRFENGTYQLKWVENDWWQPFRQSDKIFYPKLATDVYCFASVFAPTKLNTDIFHRWEYKNNDGDWVEHAYIQYKINGGSSNGYRGYSQVSNYQAGKWRCSVETERGQVLGREVFEIANIGASPDKPLEIRIE